MFIGTRNDKEYFPLAHYSLSILFLSNCYKPLTNRSMMELILIRMCTIICIICLNFCIRLNFVGVLSSHCMCVSFYSVYCLNCMTQTMMSIKNGSRGKTNERKPKISNEIPYILSVNSTLNSNFYNLIKWKWWTSGCRRQYTRYESLNFWNSAISRSPEMKEIEIVNVARSMCTNNCEFRCGLIVIRHHQWRWTNKNNGFLAVETFRYTCRKDEGKKYSNASIEKRQDSIRFFNVIHMITFALQLSRNCNWAKRHRNRKIKFNFLLFWWSSCFFFLLLVSFNQKVVEINDVAHNKIITIKMRECW